MCCFPLPERTNSFKKVSNSLLACVAVVSFRARGRLAKTSGSFGLLQSRSLERIPKSAPVLLSWLLRFSQLLCLHLIVTLTSKGRFRRYNFSLRLSHAISRARAARDMQKIAHNSRHSTLPITTLVVGF